jgi:hypothetical protein
MASQELSSSGRSADLNIEPKILNELARLFPRFSVALALYPGLLDHRNAESIDKLNQRRDILKLDAEIETAQSEQDSLKNSGNRALLLGLASAAGLIVVGVSALTSELSAAVAAPVSSALTLLMVPSIKAWRDRWLEQGPLKSTLSKLRAKRRSAQHSIDPEALDEHLSVNETSSLLIADTFETSNGEKVNLRLERLAQFRDIQNEIVSTTMQSETARALIEDTFGTRPEIPGQLTAWTDAVCFYVYASYLNSEPAFGKVPENAFAKMRETAGWSSDDWRSMATDASRNATENYALLCQQWNLEPTPYLQAVARSAEFREAEVDAMVNRIHLLQRSTPAIEIA